MDAEDKVWGQINHERVALRLKQLRKQRLKEIKKGTKSVWSGAAIPPSSQTRNDMVDLAVKQLQLWLDDKYGAYQYVWMLQKREKTPEFVRAVFHKAIVPEIKGTRIFVNHVIVRASQEIWGFQDLKPLSVGEWWALEHEENLMDDWREKTEDEAMGLEPKRTQKKPRRRSRKKSINGLAQNGAICTQVIEQMKKIRSIYPTKDMDQIRKCNPKWFVWEMMERQVFTPKDRENFRMPDQWPGTIDYAMYLLGKDLSTSERNIRRWIAAYRTSKPRRPIRSSMKNA